MLQTFSLLEKITYYYLKIRKLILKNTIEEANMGQWRVTWDKWTFFLTERLDQLYIHIGR